MTCRVCSISLSPWGVTAGVPLLICGRCGSIHADCSKPVDDLYADLYSKDEPVPDVVVASLDAVVRSMSAFRTHGRWLDIGFGQGALLDAAAQGGWSCYGTEHSPVAIEQGRARGFKTTSGTKSFEDGTFDVVSLVELLEHVEDPGSFLKEARRVLRKGGCLYVTTPNAWSLNRWVLGPSWSIFSPPDHITIFTPAALRRLLSQSGFHKTGLRAEGLNPFELLHFVKGEPKAELHRVNDGTKLCASLSSSPGRRRLKALANTILSTTRLGDSLKARSI